MILLGRKNDHGRGILKRQLPLHTMLLPGIVITLIFSYIPMYGIIMAFQDFDITKGFFGDQLWVGLGNYTYLFQMPNFINVLLNTLQISVFKIVLSLILPVIAALLINEMYLIGVKKAIQTIIYLPHFLSWVILGGILLRVLSPTNGIVNQFLGLMGVKPIFFLGSNTWFQFTVVITEQWKELGWATIIYLAAITGIDLNQYEASKIDGANRLQQVWNVTIPGISHVIVLLLVLSFGRVLNAGFDQIFNLYSPAVFESGDIIDTLVYRIGLMQHQYGLATAVGLFKGLISLILISSSYYLAHKFANYKVF